MDFVLRYEIYQFYKTISESFQPTPLEMVFIFIALVIFGGIFIVVYRHQKKKARESAVRRCKIQFDKAARKAGLDPEEREILDLVAKASPAGELKRDIILKRAAAFDEAAGILIASGEITAGEAANLRRKLSACCFEKSRGIATTRGLPAGLHLYIIHGRGPGYHGEIRLKTPETMEIGLREGGLSFRSDTALKFYFKRGTDTYYFQAPVDDSSPGTITITHPRKIKKVQRRRYYRKELNKKAFIHRSDGKYRRPTTMTDLGGGGASVKNKEGLFHKGDSVHISFSLPEFGEMNLSGTIVRTSREGEILHVQFDPLEERVRDKIISYILHK